MTALAAARLHDEIAHGFGLAAMVAGAVVGALAGAAIIAATAATGGLALVVMAGAVAGGGLAAGQILSGLNVIFDLPEPASGTIGTGAPKVLVNHRLAVRAGVDTAESCSGLPFNHPPWPAPILVREGSSTVMINGKPAARLKSKLTCGAHIKSGSPDVFIGGPWTTIGFIFDLEGWTKTGLEVLGLGALIGAGVLAAAAGLAALGSFAAVGTIGYGAMQGIGAIGDAIGPGYRDLLQGVAGMGLIVAGPKLANEGQIAADRAQITELSNAGKITEAQAILQRHVDAGNPTAVVRRLDVSSPRDGGHLWSGNGAAAKTYASNHGGVTLEQTPGGRVIDGWSELNTKMPWTSGGKEVWGGVSQNYSRGLSGEVTAVQTPSKAAVGGGDIFKQYEWPEVQKGLASGKITGFKVDPTLPEPPRRP